MPEITRDTPPGTIALSAPSDQGWQRREYGFPVISVITGRYDHGATQAVYTKRFEHGRFYPHYASMCNWIMEVEDPDA